MYNMRKFNLYLYPVTSDLLETIAEHIRSRYEPQYTFVTLLHMVRQCEYLTKLELGSKTALEEDDFAVLKKVRPALQIRKDY